MRDSATPAIRRYRSSFAGMIGLAMLLFLDLGIAGLVPWWVIVGFVLLWLVLFALGCRWFLRRPGRVLVLPLLGFAVWVPVVWLARLHGWG